MFYYLLKRPVIKAYLLVPLTLVFCLVFFIKQFGYEIFHVPSESMENLLFPGDYIIVNKLALQKENQFVSLWQNNCSDEQPRKNHASVVVFHLPEEQSGSYHVKRCIAASGDTISISNNDVYINSDLLVNPESNKMTYDVHYSDYQKIYELIVHDLNQKQAISQLQPDDFLILELTDKERKLLKSKPYVESVIPHHSFLPEMNMISIPPLVIPGKGMTIELNTNNVKTYGDLLKQHENLSIAENDEGYLINGEVQNAYTFKQDYFFMMGDNRTNSIDSRSYGLIPESFLVGKVFAVVFSFKKKAWQWDRVLLAIN